MPELGNKQLSSDRLAGKKKLLYFESLGEKFDEFMDDYDVEQRISLIFSSLLKDLDLRGSEVLEVGSGTGRISRRIVGCGARLTVIDIGQRLVSTVSPDCQSGVVGDAISLPFADASFDAVVSSECIEHTTNPRAAIEEMCRVCRPGGVVCITTPNKLWYPVLVLAQALGLRKFSGIENWIFPYQAARIMRRSGMKQISLSGCHLWPFQIKFGRALSKAVDRWGRFLYPFMINFGVMAVKDSHEAT
ncbi:MAG: class I SAM-dependent methyltransferase [Desulfomonile tiedjei]|nr:class I SAM-dependent methyltransferase [Desulfomonile tiedjei]